MTKYLKSFNANQVVLFFIVAVGAISSGCVTTNVDCGVEGSDGAGGCWPKAYVGQSVDGQPCQSGTVCRKPNAPCDMAHPSAKCTNKINAGVCECKCL